jgi:hypothetical protein
VLQAFQVRIVSPFSSSKTHFNTMSLISSRLKTFCQNQANEASFFLVSYTRSKKKHNFNFLTKNLYKKDKKSFLGSAMN